MAKTNIGTALNTAFTGSVRAALGERPDLVDPRRYLTPARTAMAETVTAALRVMAADVRDATAGSRRSSS